MNTTSVNQSMRRQLSAWYAVYTAPRHEKKVSEHLSLREVEHFLPLYQTISRWKNGCKVTVNLPLFPAYVFVHIPPEERARVLSIPSVLGIVASGREMLPIETGEIDLLRRSIVQGRCQPHPFLRVGERVRVTCGTLAGMEGILVRLKNQLRVVIALDLIKQAVSVEVDADQIEPCARLAGRALLN